MEKTKPKRHITILPWLLVAIIELLFFFFTSCTKEKPITINSDEPQQLKAAKATDKQTVYTVPIEWDVYNSCQNEYVHLTGDMDFKLRLYEPNGGVFVDYTITLNNVSAIGLVTGSQYHGAYVAIGRAQLTRIDSAGGYRSTGQIIDHLILTASGGVSVKVREVIHLTYDYDRNFRLYFDHFSESCN